MPTPEPNTHDMTQPNVPLRRTRNFPARCNWVALLLVASVQLRSGAADQALSLQSPNGRIAVRFQLHDFAEATAAPSYSVTMDGQPIIAPSRLGLQLERTSFVADLQVTEVHEESHDGTWHPVTGERSLIRDHYRQLIVHLAQRENVQRRMTVILRAYDEGIAFSLSLPPQLGMAEARIRTEHSEFRFAQDHPTWATYSAQGEYSETRLSQLKTGCERPLVVRVARDRYAAIAEAKLVDYARMKLAPLNEAQHALVSRLDGPVAGSLPFTTPWRVILVGDSPGQLLENNFLLLNLNDPCALEDTSWIRPGKVIREVTLTTAGGKACVDFAIRHGLQYVEFDAGWYGHEYDDRADATTITVDPKRSPGPLDLHDIIRYAEARDIGILVYVNRRALEKQLDVLLPLLRSWGIRGVKYGFVNVGSQEWTRWLHHAVRKAADHQLMVDIHDEYRGTGFSRTYPNLMTMEGIRGDEARPSVRQTLITTFTRMLAGRADNTVCYLNPRVDELWTHSLQLAKPVCLFSPWQFLFWYDRPEAIGDLPELQFLKALPTTWDETRVLHGAIGEYAIVARRHGSEWFVGAMNAGAPRTLPISFEFLTPRQEYHATFYTHDPEATSRTKIKIKDQIIRSDSGYEVRLLPDHGAAIRIVPARAD